MAAAVLVFDFDKTIIDCDSDTWVMESLGFSDLFYRLLPTMPWNTLMDMMMKELHEHGKTVGDIVRVLQLAPVHPLILSAIRTAHASGFDLKIVSDANSFFIETIIGYHGLRSCFSEIQTNPSSIDENGRLRIFPYHEFTSSFSTSHGCTLPTCPPNMCKGVIVERIRREAAAEGKRVVYIGDGGGDLCPGLKLGKEDELMPRKGFPLYDLLKGEVGRGVKAEVHEWGDGEELWRLLSAIIFGPMAAVLEEEEKTKQTKQMSTPICKINKVVGVSMHAGVAASVPVPQ